MFLLLENNGVKLKLPGKLINEILNKLHFINKIEVHNC